MGFRFRKSANFGPFRVNLSKSGVGWSVGVPGYRYTKKANGGTRITTSIPGTGISYVKETGKSRGRKADNDITPTPKQVQISPTTYNVCGWIALAMAFFCDMIAGVGAAVSPLVCFLFTVSCGLMALFGTIWIDAAGEKNGKPTSKNFKVGLIISLVIIFVFFAVIGALANV
ncbi:MAG: DUF4236 domain-containing protein [Fournierella sp.]|uniref:DUF4236 domain-containing protein n=1 Tax=Allofournierella sp. TaxID=1940256 RepID=UPI002A7EB173|nr:DUF4236 domain-containing protein [Fournierella sp.]MDY4166107.1 DUF4236 domain-containing protein [Fournierella sp.]